MTGLVLAHVLVTLINLLHYVLFYLMDAIVETRATQVGQSIFQWSIAGLHILLSEVFPQVRQNQTLVKGHWLSDIRHLECLSCLAQMISDAIRPSTGSQHQS